MCKYLEKDIKKTFRVTGRSKVSLRGQNIRTGDLDPYTLRARCTLPDNFDYAKWQKDFGRNGGWEAFTRMLEPQNNFFGLFLLSMNELGNQRNLELSSDLQEAQAGRGHLSIRGTSATDSCGVRSENGRCLFYKNIKTPGSYIADTLAATINQELAWFTNADELNEILVLLLTRLTDRLLDLGRSQAYPSYGPDPRPSPTPRQTIPPPPPPGPGPGPGPTGTPPGSCTPDPNGCVVNSINNTCADSAYGGDVNSAIDEVVAQGTGLAGPGSDQITDFDAYHNAVVSKMQGKGYSAIHDGEELGVKRNGFSEHWDISTSSSLVRHFHASTCTPAAF